jgi:LCP family protein required for cell wall assembly
MRDIIPVKKNKTESHPVFNHSLADNLNNIIAEEETSSNFFQETGKPASQIRHGNKKSRLWKIFYWLFLIILLGSIAYGLFFVIKINATSKKIVITLNNDVDLSLLDTLKTIATSDASRLKSQDEKINILLLGTAGVGKAGKNLTDTLMIASINKATKQVALLSLPRDLFVIVPELKAQMKINSVYQYGLSAFSENQNQAAELVEKTIEEITDLPINYYVILNFSGFEKIIDSVGGINIMNELDIYDTRYPGPNFSYETFELSKGFHRLDGATALKYVRERHNDPEGDFGRAKRQQQVLVSTKNKIFSVGTFLNPFKLNELLNALENNIATNIQPDELIGFLELVKKLDTQNINTVVIDAWNKESLLKVSHVFYGDLRSFILVPRVGNWSEIQELANNIFDLNEIRRKKEEIQKEDARVLIVNQSGHYQLAEKIRKLLDENLNYKKVTVSNISSQKLTDSSLIYDGTRGNKPFTLSEIATKLPAKVASYETCPETLCQNDNYDIVVVVGKDLIERYTIEEDTLEDLNNARDQEEQLNYIDLSKNK